MIGAQYAIGGAFGFGLTLLFGYILMKAESKTHKFHSHSLRNMWIMTLPWIPVAFTVFIQNHLSCNGLGEYDVDDTMRAFLTAGSVASVNCIGMIGFTEILVNFWNEKWKRISKAGKFTLAMLALCIYWTWHAIVLYWIAESFMSGTISRGIFLALHISTYVITVLFTLAISYKSSPCKFSINDKTGKKRHARIIISAFLVGGIVVGVVAVSTMSGTRSLVPILGDIPILSIVSTSWVYWERKETEKKKMSDDECRDREQALRRWVHGIQLLYKSTPLFLMLTAATLLQKWIPLSCGVSGAHGWGGRIAVSISVGVVTTAISYGFYWWLHLQQKWQTNSTVRQSKDTEMTSVSRSNKLLF